MTRELTTIQSRHITELRTAIDGVRTHLGLPAYSWQYTAVAVGDPIKADPNNQIGVRLAILRFSIRS